MAYKKTTCSLNVCWNRFWFITEYFRVSHLPVNLESYLVALFAKVSSQRLFGKFYIWNFRLLASHFFFCAIDQILFGKRDFIFLNFCAGYFLDGGYFVNLGRVQFDKLRLFEFGQFFSGLDGEVACCAFYRAPFFRRVVRFFARFFGSAFGLVLFFSVPFSVSRRFGFGRRFRWMDKDHVDGGRRRIRCRRLGRFARENIRQNRHIRRRTITRNLYYKIQDKIGALL